MCLLLFSCGFDIMSANYLLNNPYWSLESIWLDLFCLITFTDFYHHHWEFVFFLISVHAGSFAVTAPFGQLLCSHMYIVALLSTVTSPTTFVHIDIWRYRFIYSDLLLHVFERECFAIVQLLKMM